MVINDDHYQGSPRGSRGHQGSQGVKEASRGPGGVKGSVRSVPGGQGGRPWGPRGSWSRQGCPWGSRASGVFQVVNSHSLVNIIFHISYIMFTHICMSKKQLFVYLSESPF